jgi:hypothetical protein
VNAEAFKLMADDYAAAHEAHESLLHGFYTEEEEDAAKDAIVAARIALFSTMDEVVEALIEAANALECARYSEQPVAKKCRAVIAKATGAAT